MDPHLLIPTLVDQGAIPAAQSQELLDAIVASDLLEYVDKPADLMVELHRVMRSRTRLILHVPVPA